MNEECETKDSELTFEDKEKVSGGFSENELREEDRNHLHELHSIAFLAWKKARENAEAKQEYEDAVKALHAYEEKLANDYGDHWGII